jgi:hypothetical protein
VVCKYHIGLFGVFVMTLVFCIAIALKDFYFMLLSGLILLGFFAVGLKGAMEH